MTRSEQESRQDYGPTETGDLSEISPITSKLLSNSVSDSEISERPVREALKKTSIASIAQHAVKGQDTSVEDVEILVEIPNTGIRHSSLEKEIHAANVNGLRGRPVKKRSLEDLEEAYFKERQSQPDTSQVDKLNSHVRKRSRDVLTGKSLKEDGRPSAFEIPPQEEIGDSITHREPIKLSANDLDNPVGSVAHASEICFPTGVINKFDELAQDEIIIQSIPSAAVKNFSDQEMQDSTSSPRKKRSRDHFDTEADREQKIPATDEARAHRRSDELDRFESSNLKSAEIAMEASNVAEMELEAAEAEPECGPKPHPSVSKNESTLEVLGESDESAPPTKPSFGSGESIVGDKSESSRPDFPSPSFAALSKSSASPFGSFAASSAKSNSFSSALGFSPQLTKTEGGEDRKMELPINGGFGAFAKTSSAFGSVEPSPFVKNEPSKLAIFGGSVFGGGFTGDFSGGPKLTSFAAPTGNAQGSSINGIGKPVGSSTREGEQNEDSESEDNDPAESVQEDQNEGADNRFQHKDVETGEDGEFSIFTSRATLYTFKDKVWKEGGKGMFKLNITASSQAEKPGKKTGRFIMRAHQTYRVLLNAPVYDKMKIGDGKGNEPSGKSFSLAVMEDAKLVPYMVKLGDVAESRTLYHEVRKLQESLLEPQATAKMTV